MIALADIPLGYVVPFMFDTYDSNGASVTISGLAVTDIEIYKSGSTTQRSSDNGYTLLDTDGIDFDGTTGLHGFSIDFTDNSDSGFYAAGYWYTINVNAITIDSQTVRFSYSFRLINAENTRGAPVIDVGRINNVATSSVTTVNANIGTTQPINFTGTGASALVKSDMVDIAGAAVSTSTAQIGVNVVNFGGSAGTFSSGRPEVNTTHWAGTAVGSVTITANMAQLGGSTQSATDLKDFADDGYDPTTDAVVAVAFVGALGTQAKADVNAEVDTALSDYGALQPTTAGRKLDVTATGGAGIDWSNVENPTTTLALTGTTISTSQKVDVNTIKTNPVANAGTVTFPTDATLASTTNITSASGVALTSAYDAAKTAATQTSVDTIDDLLDTEVAAIKAKTDLIPAAPAAVGDIPTAAQNADKLLGRNIQGGADGTRTVSEALYRLRNRTRNNSGTLEVYLNNDSTVSWSAALTTGSAATEVTDMDPS